MRGLLQELDPGHPLEEAQSVFSAVVIANRRAGRVLQMGREAFEQAVLAAFARHGITARVQFFKGSDLAKAIKRAMLAPEDLLVLAGGDGTLSHALKLLMTTQKRCAILPLGTLNLLGRDLELSGDLDADIAALAQGRPHVISLARVNGRLFHTNAGFGLLSVMARERENARRAFPFSRAISFFAACVKTLLTYRPIEVELEAGGETSVFSADTVLVTSNRFEGMPWRRNRLDEGIIEVHLLEARGMRSRLKLFWLMVRGRWREHEHLTSLLARRFTVRKRRKNSLALSIDGEACRMHGPVTFDVAPERLTLHA